MIEVSNLTKSFGKLKVFEQISFQVKDREGLFLTGPSGCGKTTLLRILSGFEPDYEGELLIDGRKISPKDPPASRNIAIVFQEPTLWNHMTVEKNMSYGMKQPDRAQFLAAAEGLQIQDLLKKYPEEISGGQAKRVSLARALLSGKKNLLLDEPLSNVDPTTKEIIVEFIKGHYLENRCILYVTHDKEEMEGLPFGRVKMENLPLI